MLGWLLVLAAAVKRNATGYVDPDGGVSYDTIMDRQGGNAEQPMTMLWMRMGGILSSWRVGAACRARI
jgi:hypothetical protein